MPSALLAVDRIVDLPAGDHNRALRVLWESICKSPQVVDPAGLWEALLEREEQASTAIGQGIAIPHAKHASCSGLVLALGRVRDGCLAYATPDGQPLRLLMMLVASDRQTREFIRVLARLSMLLQKPGVVAGLIDLPAAQALDLVRQHE